MKRNKGNHEGKYIGGVLDNSWAVYETATGFRASSVATTLGKANYTFGIKEGKIDKHAGMDAGKLQEQRPELYEAIETLFNSPDFRPVADPSDEFGDIAWSQRKPFSPMQEWKRALLYMRMFELEHAAKGGSGAWDAGIRMSYSAIFKFKIDDDTYAKAMHYITNHGDVELQTLLAVLRDFYDGKYRPNSCATLDTQFNLIAGEKDEFSI